ncbi:MAG: hypothetical protein Kow0020_06610 [Wenzhouxiangellaceae bacterium]
MTSLDGIYVYWDGAPLRAINPAVNVDAVDVVDFERLLISVDTDLSLPGGLVVNDDDILWVNRFTNEMGLLYPPRTDHPSWVGADLDALWAEAIQGGEVRLLSAYHEVQESAGTLTIQLERTGGNEGAVSIQVDAIGATATEGSDFSGDQTLINLWADGEDGVRSFSITIVNDSSQEPHEQFSVQISVSAGAATLGSPSQAQIVILDDDGQNLFSDGFES